MIIGDIDIDVKPKFDASFFGWTPASTIDATGKIKKHPVGYHPQTIPIDPISGFAAPQYQIAEELGYVKIDFLTLNLYDDVQSREDLDLLMAQEPDWDMLLDDEIQPQLFQLARHGEILKQLAPKSVIELANVLALIRPGKQGLLQTYKKYPQLVSDILWEDSGTGYLFKKSHAVCYALVIVLQLNILRRKKTQNKVLG